MQQLLHGSLLQMCSANSTGITSEDNHAAVPRLQPQSLADLASCFSQGLLQHYNLYSLCLTRQQQHEQHRHDLVVSCQLHLHNMAGILLKFMYATSACNSVLSCLL